MRLWLKVILALLFYYLFMVILTTISPALWVDFFPHSKSHQVVVTAHRGAAGYAPENTLAAIEKGLESGAQRIEVDIHQSKDGKLFIMHDETLDRTTNGHGLLKDMNSDELLKLDAGSWFSAEYHGEKLPLLDQAFKMINGKAVFVIELKHGSDFYPGIEKKVVDMVRRYNAYEWVIIHSFDDNVLRTIHRLDPKITLHKLFVFKTNLFPLMYDVKIHLALLKDYLFTKEISVYYKFVNPALVSRAHKLGFKVNAWTVDDPEVAKRLVNMGVDGIITNYPNEIMHELGIK